MAHGDSDGAGRSRRRDRDQGDPSEGSSEEFSDDDASTRRRHPALDVPPSIRTTAEDREAPPAPDSREPLEPEATEATLPPFVEVELVYQTGHPGMERAFRAVEVWTRNHVYSMQWSMECLQVVDRRTGEVVPDAKMLGMSLVGGQSTQEDGIEITSPWPRPGNQAVFRRAGAGGFVTTSTVVRVVLRLRVLTVPQQRVQPTWDDLSKL